MHGFKVFISQHSIEFVLLFAAAFCFGWLMVNRKKLRMNWVAALVISLNSAGSRTLRRYDHPVFRKTER